MARQPETRPNPWGEDVRSTGYGGFDVTCSIGHVEITPDGDVPPHVAAFRLIAEHDAQGTFRFPMADGRECVVDVAFEGDAR